MSGQSSYMVDPGRLTYPETGICVRAQHDDRWVNADIVHLDRDSLARWLRSRGGDNPWAESVVLALLGHDRGDDTTGGTG